MINDSSARYGSVTRLLHWVMAVLIVWQFLKFFDRINDGEHWVGQNLVSWHISIGSLVLLLAVVRLVWALKQKSLRPVPQENALLVKLGHGLLYAGMLLLPITGAMLMVGNGYGWSAFGIEFVARGAEKSDWMAAIGSVHALLAWCMLILVAGHIAMALIHRFLKNDDVLKRML